MDICYTLKQDGLFYHKYLDLSLAKQTSFNYRNEWIPLSLLMTNSVCIAMMMHHNGLTEILMIHICLHSHYIIGYFQSRDG